MSGALARAGVHAAIVALESRLLADPTAAGLRVERAQLLEVVGRRADALQAYVDVLASDASNVDALCGLGLLVLAAGNRELARTLLHSATLFGPEHAAAHAHLAYVLQLDGASDDARALYERALALDGELAGAHHGLAELLERRGETAAADAHRVRGLQARPITIRRYRGTTEPIAILALGSAAFGNVATDAFFDDTVFLVASLVVEYAAASLALPPHDLVFNAIGEADLCPAALASAASIALRSGAPVINDPRVVAQTGRVANARRLGALAGVRTPRTSAFPRAALCAPTAPQTLSAAGFGFPLLVRSPGFHTGEHFVKVDAPGDLAPVVAQLPGDDLFVIEFIDVRAPDGSVRKYRAIIVDGRLYPLHVAIADTWKVHYFRAGMAERPDRRAEDAAFVADLPGTLGPAATAALERIAATLRLDYGGIDFALGARGEVVVFEANASMIVPRPDDDPRWDYRRPAVERIYAAVRALLIGRARRGSAGHEVV